MSEIHLYASFHLVVDKIYASLESTVSSFQFILFAFSQSQFKQGCIHDNIIRVRWAGAATEVRSPFGEKK